MDTIQAMRYFARTVELGSMSAAAREFGTTQSTVSKIVGKLETELGVRLLERSTTGLALTDQGSRFFERAKCLLEDYETAVADARGLTERAVGLLRINAPVGFGQFLLNGLIREFLDTYPEIEIELILNDRFVDLVEEGVDVVVRLGQQLPPDAIARKIATAPRWLVAAPDYLARHGKPRSPVHLSDHEYIRFAWSSSGDIVELQGPQGTVEVKISGRYRVNNALALRESLVMGAGIGLCPVWLVQDLVTSGQLQRVLPKWQALPQEMFLIYLSRRYQPFRTRLLLDFLEARIPALPGFTTLRAS